MRIAFLTESLKGTHLPIPFEAEVFILNYDFISYNGRNFHIPQELLNPIIEYKPDVVVYGHDYDLQGQKIASCIKTALPQFPAIRMPFCDEGYFLIGDFYSQEQMSSLAKYSFLETVYLKRLLSNGLHPSKKVGLSKAIALSELLDQKDIGVKNINPSGTSTITIMTKAEIGEIGD